MPLLLVPVYESLRHLTRCAFGPTLTQRAVPTEQGTGPAQCGPGVVGGHYDPTLACSPDTNEKAACGALGRTPANVCGPVITSCAVV
jgi:hypothetical protein